MGLLYYMGTHISSRNIPQIMGTIIIKYLYKFMGTIVLLFYVILSEKGETPYVK